MFALIQYYTPINLTCVTFTCFVLSTKIMHCSAFARQRRSNNSNKFSCFYIIKFSVQGLMLKCYELSRYVLLHSLDKCINISIDYLEK